MRADLGELTPLSSGGAGAPRSLTPDLRPCGFLGLCSPSAAAPWGAAQAPTAELLVGAGLQGQLAVLGDKRSSKSSEWVEGGARTMAHGGDWVVTIHSNSSEDFAGEYQS